ncbi:MAG: hypothetical protein K6F91_08355 [Ruminococcus sp.]|nr:hypothetical protein [Ruminococcus sp.]
MGAGSLPDTALRADLDNVEVFEFNTHALFLIPGTIIIEGNGMVAEAFCVMDDYRAECYHLFYLAYICDIFGEDGSAPLGAAPAVILKSGECAL